MKCLLQGLAIVLFVVQAAMFCVTHFSLEAVLEFLSLLNQIISATNIIGTENVNVE